MQVRRPIGCLRCYKFSLNLIHYIIFLKSAHFLSKIHVEMVIHPGLVTILLLINRRCKTYFMILISVISILLSWQHRNFVLVVLIHVSKQLHFSSSIHRIFRKASAVIPEIATKVSVFKSPAAQAAA